jgi:hypothetical protein
MARAEARFARLRVFQTLRPGPIRLARTIVLVVLTVAAACNAPTDVPEGETFTPPVLDSAQVAMVAQFDSLYAALNGGAGCAAFNDDDGTYAWAESYLLMALLTMYEATKDTAYLTTFADQADAVLATRDSERGIVDYLGRSLPTWSSTRYTLEGQRRVSVVRTSMVAYPLARFAVLVGDESRLGRYDARAAAYADAAEQALAVFDQRFFFNSETLEGEYRLEPGAPIAIGDSVTANPVPLNYNAAAGRVHLMLALYTGSAVHWARAAALSRAIATELAVVGDRYVWHYWGVEGRDLFSDRWEDLSHGAIDVDFAAELANAGLTFDSSDIQRFAATLLHQRAGTGFLHYVEGPDPAVSEPDSKCGHTWMRSSSDASGRWLGLESLVPGAVFTPVRDYLAQRTLSDDATDPVLLLGLARLVLYHRTEAPALAVR